MDHLSRAQRSQLMRRVRTRNTAPEVALRRALWAAGLRGWRLHPKGITGQPDFAWIGRRVAVFVDGAFWHGHPHYYWGQSGAFWDEKIARNRSRDERVDSELGGAGWTVVRIWDFEVETDLQMAVERVRASWADACGTDRFVRRDGAGSMSIGSGGGIGSPEQTPASSGGEPLF